MTNRFVWMFGAALVSAAASAQSPLVHGEADRNLVMSCRAVSNRVPPVIGKALAVEVKRYEEAYEFASTADEKLTAETSLRSMCVAAMEGRRVDPVPVVMAPPTPEQIQADLDAVIRQAQEDQTRLEQARVAAGERQRLEALAAAEAQAAAEQQRAQAQIQEQARLAAEAAALRAAEEQRAEETRLAQVREIERQEQGRVAAEARARAEAEAAAVAEAEAQRVAAQREAQRIEAARLAQEEQARVEAERIAAAEAEAARLKAEAQARVEAERLSAEAAERDRLAAVAAREQEDKRIAEEQAQMAREREEARAALALTPVATRAVVPEASPAPMKSATAGGWGQRSMIRVLGTPPKTNKTSK